MQNIIKIYKHITVYNILSMLLLVVIFVAIIFPISMGADSSLATAGTLVSPSLTLDSTSSSARVSLVVGDTAGSFAASGTDDTAKFNVSTTNYTGYTLQIVAGDDNGALANGSEVLNSISATASGAAGFTNGTWGYVPSFYNGSSNTNYLVSPTTTAVTLDTTSSANTAAKDYTIGLGVKADYTKPAGEYTKTFTLIATANSVAYAITYANNTSDTVTYVDPDTSATKTLPQVIAGQISVASVNLLSAAPVRDGYSFLGWCDVAPTSDATVCSGTTYAPGAQYMLDPETGNAVTLYAYWKKNTVDMQNLDPSLCVTSAPIDVVDSRDGEVYKVQRLADGNCWLLDNLRLDLANADVQTKLNSATTNASDTALGYLKNGGGSSPYPSSGVVAKTVSGGSWADSYNLPYIATSGSGWTSNTTTTGYGSGSGKIGVYYNYCAASAGTYCYASDSGTDNASQDVCPAGWRIPTGGASGEYQALYLASSNSAANFLTALSTPLSGNFLASTSAGGHGNYGDFWSSTRSNGNGMYSLRVRSSSIYPQDSSNRYAGGGVRCVMKTYMQDFTDTEASALAEGGV